jgi:hypothetical protein
VSAGGGNSGLKVLLKLFAGICILTALCELGGGVALIVYSCLDQKDLETRLRQVFIMVRYDSTYPDKILIHSSPDFYIH